MKSRWRPERVAIALLAGMAFTIVVPALHSAPPTTADVNLQSAIGYSLVVQGALVLGATPHFTGPAPISGAISPTAISGTDQGALEGAGMSKVENGSVAAASALRDVSNALAVINSLPGTTTTSELGGKTFIAGVYDAPLDTASSIASSITLDGENNYNSIFIFRTTRALAVTASVAVNFINHAQPSNIYWVVGAALNIGADANVPGNFIVTADTVTGDSSIIQGSLFALGAANLGASSTIAHSARSADPAASASNSASSTPTETSTATPSSTPAESTSPTSAPIVLPAPIVQSQPRPIREFCDSFIVGLFYEQDLSGGNFGKITWITTGAGSVRFIGASHLYPQPFIYGTYTRNWDGTLITLRPGIMYTVSIHFLADCGRESERTILLMNHGVMAPTLTPEPMPIPTSSALIPNLPIVLPLPTHLVQSIPPTKPSTASTHAAITVQKPRGAPSQQGPIFESVKISASGSLVTVVLHNLILGQKVLIVMRAETKP